MKTIKRIFFAVLLMTITSGAFAQMSKATCESILKEGDVANKGIIISVGTNVSMIPKKDKALLFKEDCFMIKTSKETHNLVYDKIRRIVIQKKTILIEL